MLPSGPTCMRTHNNAAGPTKKESRVTPVANWQPMHQAGTKEPMTTGQAGPSIKPCRKRTILSQEGVPSPTLGGVAWPRAAATFTAEIRKTALPRTRDPLPRRNQWPNLGAETGRVTAAVSHSANAAFARPTPNSSSQSNGGPPNCAASSNRTRRT